MYLFKDDDDDLANFKAFIRHCYTFKFKNQILYYLNLLYSCLSISFLFCFYNCIIYVDRKLYIKNRNIYLEVFLKHSAIFRFKISKCPEYFQGLLFSHFLRSWTCLHPVFSQMSVYLSPAYRNYSREKYHLQFVNDIWRIKCGHCNQEFRTHFSHLTKL